LIAHKPKPTARQLAEAARRQQLAAATAALIADVKAGKALPRRRRKP
jgi:hypothetical protein